MKQGSDYPFSLDVRQHYKYNYVHGVHKRIDLSSKVVVNQALVGDLYVKQSGIYFGLYDSAGTEVLEPKYDNYFVIDEKGVLIFRMTNFSKKEGDLKHYTYGFLNIYTKEKTYCVYNKVTKLFPGLYDAQQGYIEHHLIKSDCKESYNYYKKITIIAQKIVLATGWSKELITNSEGNTLFEGMEVHTMDFSYGHIAGANCHNEAWIVDDDGNMVRKLPYKKIGGIRYEYAPVFDGKGWGYSDLYGRLVVPCKYDLASPIDEKGNVNVQKTDILHKMWGVTTLKFTDLLKK